MPLYDYETENGERVTVLMGVAEMQKRQGRDGSITLDDGRRGQRCYDAAPNNVRNGCWPRLSDALGVHPSQIKEATKQLIDGGTNARFHPDGRMEITSNSHEKAVMRALGCKEAGIVNRKSYT